MLLITSEKHWNPRKTLEKQYHQLKPAEDGVQLYESIPQPKLQESKRSWVLF